MSGPTIWAILGLEHTRDKAAIRRAYAVRLKTVHPEDDAAGFQALRAAYEQAMALADRAAFAETQEAREAAEPSPEPTLAPDCIHAQAEPPVAVSAYDQACIDLHGLAHGEKEPEEAEMLAALDRLLQSIAAGAVDLHLRAEIWLAILIAQNIPRTDCLVTPAMAAFGWSLDVQTHPAVVAVARRQLFLEHLAGRAKLETLLRGAAEPDEDRLFSAMEAAITRPVLQDFQIRPLVETWLAHLLVETAPRSNPLLRTAAARMGWNGPAATPDEDAAIAAIRQKCAASDRARFTQVRTRQTSSGSGGGVPAGLIAAIVFVVIFVVRGVVSQPTNVTDYSTPSVAPSTVEDARVFEPETAPQDVIDAVVGVREVRFDVHSDEAGRATLRCREMIIGSLSGCQIASARPSGKGPAALEIAQRIRLSPPKMNGRPVESSVIIDLVFHRDGRRSPPIATGGGYLFQRPPPTSVPTTIPNFDREWKGTRPTETPAENYAPNISRAIPAAPTMSADQSAKP